MPLCEAKRIDTSNVAYVLTYLTKGPLVVIEWSIEVPSQAIIRRQVDVGESIPPNPTNRVRVSVTFSLSLALRYIHLLFMGPLVSYVI